MIIRVKNITLKDDERIVSDTYVVVERIVSISTRYKGHNSNEDDIIGSFIQLDDGNGLYVCCEEKPEEIARLMNI